MAQCKRDALVSPQSIEHGIRDAKRLTRLMVGPVNLDLWHLLRRKKSQPAPTNATADVLARSDDSDTREPWPERARILERYYRLERPREYFVHEVFELRWASKDSGEDAFDMTNVAIHELNLGRGMPLTQRKH
jgi:hypothetical protein